MRIQVNMVGSSLHSGIIGKYYLDHDRSEKNASYRHRIGPISTYKILKTNHFCILVLPEYINSTQDAKLINFNLITQIVIILNTRTSS